MTPETDPGNKRQAILDAALALFSAHGFHGAPTSAIAARAGVGVGTIYRHFRDKDALIRELFRVVHERFHRRVFSDLPADTALRERFLALFTRILQLFLEFPREFRFMEQYHFSPYRETPPVPEEEAVRHLLVSGRDGGVFKEAPLPVLEAIAFGPIVALAKDHLSHGVAVDAAMIRTTVEACWDGLQR